VVSWYPSKLTADLRALGVSAGDVVMVHASLRAIGSVAGGAAAVVQALEDAVGSAGTLLMNLGARDDYDWVNKRPESERIALLEGAPAFEALKTPADPDVGVLAEVFRRLHGTVVSDQPDARFGARGDLARQLLAEPLPWDDYYGPGSVLDRFSRAAGKILRIGADPDTVTLLHLAEYLVDLPDKRRVVLTTKYWPRPARRRSGACPVLTTATAPSPGMETTISRLSCTTTWRTDGQAKERSEARTAS
jgi:aminoglycoside N3'-acetyltransferase